MLALAAHGCACGDDGARVDRVDGASGRCPSQTANRSHCHVALGVGDQVEVAAASIDYGYRRHLDAKLGYDGEVEGMALGADVGTATLLISLSLSWNRTRGIHDSLT